MCLSCSGPAVRRLLLRLELRWAVGPHGGLPGHAGGDAAAVQRADGHLLQRRPRTGALRRVARAAAAPEEQRAPGPQAHPQAGHAAAQGLVSGKVDRPSFTLFLPSSMHLNLEIVSRWVPPCAIQTMLRFALKSLNCSVLSSVEDHRIEVFVRGRINGRHS